MSKIAITINDVIRKYTSSVKDSYQNYRDYMDSLSEKNFDQQHYIDDNEELILVETKSEQYIASPESDPFRFTEKYIFYSKEDFEDFLYSDYGFKIYSGSDLTYIDVNSDFSKLYKNLVDRGHQVTLISQETLKTISPTFFFLAQNQIITNNLKFLTNYSLVHELFDTIITANPYIIENFKKDNDENVVIKIKTDYNSKLEADISVDKLSEIIQYIND